MKTGIDRMGCTLDAAMDLNIVDRKGSWYAYKGKNLAQGRQNVVELLKNDKDLSKQLETEVRLALTELGTKSDSSIEKSSFDDDLTGASVAVEIEEIDSEDSFAESFLE
jgi:recombination protein RecA